MALRRSEKRWQSRVEFCKGSVENSIAVASDSNVLAMARWGEVTLRMAMALHRTAKAQ